MTTHQRRLIVAICLSIIMLSIARDELNIFNHDNPPTREAKS